MNQILMQIPAQAAVTYPINIGMELLNVLRASLPNKGRLVVITDDNVQLLYGKQILELLTEYEPLIISFVAGEDSKNAETKQIIEKQMIDNHCDRDTIILALGGGVVGDLAGYVASTYMRGISYIQIPTTLLAMVDSSVGGKTAINTPLGKNLIGTFWQPSSVIVDLNFLKTLPEIQMINGLVEAIKMFLTCDVGLFNFTNQSINNILQQDFSVLKNVIEQAIKIKVEVVSCDEKENHQRAILNFGHTIGHALEKLSDYKMLHGYAVARGILVEAKISQLLGHLSKAEFELIKEIFLKLNISGDEFKKFNVDKIIKATKSDKKIKNNQVRYVLLKKLGHVYSDKNLYVHPVADEVVKQAILAVSEV